MYIISPPIDIRAPDRREGRYTPFADGACGLGGGRPVAVLPEELVELNATGRYTADLAVVRLGVTAGRHCALVSWILFGIAG